MFYNVLIFVFSFVLLALAANWTVGSLTFLARFFKWREFVLVYFVLVIGATIPNLAVGIFSSAKGVPDLFFGDVIGNSLITLTLMVGLAALISGGLKAESRLVQKSSIFIIFTVLVPLLLTMDGELSRGDGIILLILFLLYSGWLFSKRKLLDHSLNEEEVKTKFSSFLKSLLGTAVGILILVLAGKWIVESSIFFADVFNIELAFLGLSIVAAGTSLPELFFVITAARKKNNWLALGGIIGDVIALPTLGLGIIAIISPIKVTFSSSFFLLFVFLIAASVAFIWAVRSGNKITKKEAFPFLAIYFSFLLYEIISRIFF